MKKKSVISLGPGAPSLILMFVVLALCMLGMLSLLNGWNDAGLSKRSIQVTQAVYELNTKAEMTRSDIDSALAGFRQRSDNDEEYRKLIAKELSGVSALELLFDEDEISWSETDGIHTLSCAVRVMPFDSDIREKWSSHTLLSVAALEAEEEDMFEW